MAVLSVECQVVSGRRGKGWGYSQGEKDTAVIQEVRGGALSPATTCLQLSQTVQRTALTAADS